MARQVANVDILTDTFEIWVLQTNELLNALSTEIITANSAVGVTGNTTHPRKARLIGEFSSNVMVVTNELRGGNISSTGGTYANLNISTNTIISNATSTDLILRVANSSQSANLTPIDLKIGISTVNTITISVGSNLIANATTLFIGNSTFNSIVDRTKVNISNTSQNLLANITGIYVGNTTVNSQLISSSLIVSDTTQNILANTTGVYVGNTVVNASVTSALITVANSTGTSNISPISFITGTTVVNTSVISVGSNVSLNTSSLFVGNTTVNSTLNSSQFRIIDETGNLAANSTNLTVGISTINSAAVAVGSNLISNSTTYFVGNTISFSSIKQANIYTTGNLAVVGNVNFSNTLTVNGAVVLGNTLNVVGEATFNSPVNLLGGINGVLGLSNTYYIIVSVNNDIGSTTGSPVKVYEFPVADYSSGKFEVQVKKGSNTQISELVLAHNTTTAYVSVYGTVASPPNANGSVSPLGTFTANINSGNVHLLLTPTIANSAVKVIAHLIK
jgi:hypothetical protein